MIHSPSLTRWVLLLLLFIAVFYSLWWLADGGKLYLAGIKILMESLVPALFSHVEKVMYSLDGGWRLGTNIHPVDNQSVTMVLGIDRVFLSKCVVWVPAALAFIFATAFRQPKRVIAGTLLTVGMSVATVIICLAAHLAVLINATPALLDDDLLPPPADIALAVSAYPVWYFHLVTFGNYLVILVAPLVVPVLIWVAVCHRQAKELVLLQK